MAGRATSGIIQVPRIALKGQEHMSNIATPGGEGPRKASGSIAAPNLRRGPKRFFAEVGRELRKVDWPARAETNRMTGVVLAICLIIVTILSSLSYLFDIVLTAVGGGKH